MKKRRFISMLMACVMTAGCLVGCGQSNGEQEKTAEKVQTESSSKVAEESQTTESDAKKPITTDPVTISILTTRHTTATNDASDLWYFKYLEYWFEQQGYDVTIDVQQTMETGQQISLLLGTDTLPDLIWGIGLNPSQAVAYGAGEGMILDWTPYLNEETMPNAYAAIQQEDGSLAASICNDGAIYGLPYLSPRLYESGTTGANERLYIDQRWLDECGIDAPTTIEELLDMLRTFRDKMELESGEDVIPLISVAHFFEKYLWTAMGYYGNTLSANGTVFDIKDEKVHLPAYTEDYRTFVEIMNTCYQEGLISQDYYTMDTTTARGLTKSGASGAVCDWTLQNVPEFENWICAEPMVIDDNELYVTAVDSYTANQIWASADTEYPEIIAMLVDYLYSEEGAFYHRYGPMEGNDPLNMLEGWHFDEDNQITTKEVEESDGAWATFTDYARQYIYPFDNAGLRPATFAYGYELAGVDIENETYIYEDAVTGKPITTVVRSQLTHDTVEGHWRLITIEKWHQYSTVVKLPAVYMSEEDALRATELQTLINSYVDAETAKFVTGLRPLSEVDDYFAELKAMGVEEYIELYRDAYSGYMDSVFK